MEGKRVWFGIGDIKKHIAKHHPGCPKQIRKQIVANICCRNWHDATIGFAVGLTMENYVRHGMTQYDALLAAGEDREAARQRVRQSVDFIISGWSDPNRNTTEAREDGERQRIP